MGLKLSKGNNAITVFDKDKYIAASGDELVPIEGVVYGGVKNSIINIITSGLRMSDSSKELYNTILTEYSSVTGISIKDLINRTSTKYHKSPITYKRSVDALAMKGVISRNTKDGIISLRPEYNITDIVEAARYIVIAVNPSTTDLQPVL